MSRAPCPPCSPSSRLSRSRFSIPLHASRLSQIDHETSQPDLWADPDRAQRLIAEQKAVRRLVDPFAGLKSDLGSAGELVALSDPAGDLDVLSEIKTSLPGLETRLGVLDRQALFRHPDDVRGAILSIQAGAGGVDAMDWALKLERMYTRYLEGEGFTLSIADRLAGGTAGIHYVDLEIRGPYAYGKLKAERGVHRVQHVSAFDSNGKKQTSFASVDVTPIFPATSIELLEKDLDYDTFCSGGPGGQNVNKVASAVRVRHLPTGVIVKCQSQRSQHQNKVIALEILASKLHQLEEDRKERRPKLEASFGHQTRTYVLEPYQLIKDHQSGYETSKTTQVLDGALWPFQEAYLMTS